MQYFHSQSALKKQACSPHPTASSTVWYSSIVYTIDAVTNATSIIGLWLSRQPL